MSQKLPLKNTPHSYGLIAIWLHWIVAAAFIANYTIIYYLDWFVEPRTEQAKTLISTHTAIGMSVIVFVLLRIFWRLTNRQPADAPGSWWEHLAAHTAHIALYAIMIILPLTGYLGTGGPSQLFFAIEIPAFRETQLFSMFVEGTLGMSWEEFEAPMDFIHKKGGEYVVSALILLHAGAALYHHFVRKDDVLVRMLSPIEKQADNNS